MYFNRGRQVAVDNAMKLLGRLHGGMRSVPRSIRLELARELERGDGWLSTAETDALLLFAASLMDEVPGIFEERETCGVRFGCAKLMQARYELDDDAYVCRPYTLALASLATAGYLLYSRADKPDRARADLLRSAAGKLLSAAYDGRLYERQGWRVPEPELRGFAPDPEWAAADG